MLPYGQENFLFLSDESKTRIDFLCTTSSIEFSETIEYLILSSIGLSNHVYSCSINHSLFIMSLVSRCMWHFLHTHVHSFPSRQSVHCRTPCTYSTPILRKQYTPLYKRCMIFNRCDWLPLFYLFRWWQKIMFSCLSRIKGIK